MAESPASQTLRVNAVTTISQTFESTGIATLADASLLKTSAAPTTDAMIANKKYVDDQVANYQPLDAGLTSLAGLTYASDSFIKVTAEDTYAIRTIAETKTDLNLVIGTDVQAYHANLAAIAAGTWTGAASITTLGTIATGTWQATDIGIAYGGTGQSTAQLAINALSAVGAATNEHVLTKDTATGNAIWKVATGGGATTALDNLASVAINTSLISDTADTDSLGSTTKEWLNLYIGDAGKIYLGLGQDLSIHRSAANEMTLTASSRVVISGSLLVGSIISIGDADVSEAELEILDGCTCSTTQLNYLNQSSGVTGTNSTNIVFSDSPAFTGNITIANGGTIGQAAGPLLTFDDTNNYLEITGCNVGIGTDTPLTELVISAVGDEGFEFDVYPDKIFLTAFDRGVDNKYITQHFRASDFIWAVGSTTKMTLDTSEIKSELPIKIKETAAAVADTAAYGQYWVKNTVPNVPWFTDDAGNDGQFMLMRSNSISSDSDAADVQGCNVLWVDTSGGNVTLGGLANGVDNQLLYVFKYGEANILTIEHQEGTGTQKFMLNAADLAYDGTGVCVPFVCKGGTWYIAAYPRSFTA
jgi:hypothetical protein